MDGELAPRAAPTAELVTPAPGYTERDLHLDDETVDRLIAAKPENTRRVYAWAVGQFIDWCRLHGRVPLPATQHTLTAYVSALMSAGRQPAGLEQAIGVIRSWHRHSGYPDQPATVDAVNVVRLAKRLRAEKGQGQKQAVPFTPHTLHRCIEALDLDTLPGRRDQLVLVFGFMLMARRSELARINFADVTETPDGLDVLIRTSKTDKMSEGSLRSLPPQSHPDGDPIRALRAWRQQLAARDVPLEGALLRRFSRATDPRPIGRLSADGINDIVHDAATRARLPDADRYTAHSLRAGGLTDALRRGVPLGIAARHGGWNPESPVPARYARVANRWKDNAMRGAL